MQFNIQQQLLFCSAKFYDSNIGLLKSKTVRQVTSPYEISCKLKEKDIRNN